VSLRGRLPLALLAIWMAATTVVYFRQFAGPAIRYLSSHAGHH